MCAHLGIIPRHRVGVAHTDTLSHTHSHSLAALMSIISLYLYSTRSQVELNRAILKNVGKRVFLEPVNGPWASSRYQERQQEQQQQQLERQQAALREQLRREQLQQQHFPSQLWSIGWPQTTGSQSYAPSSSSSSSSSALSTSSTGSSRFFDFLQRPEAQARHQQQQQQERQQQETAGGQQLLDDASKSLGLSLGVADVAKHQQSQSQSNGNEIANETNHENGSRKSQLQLQSAIGKSARGDEDEDNVDDDAKDQEDMLDELYYHWATEQPDELEEQNNANGRLPWRLFYRMHKNSHYAN